jgi:hypothetical protein
LYAAAHNDIFPLSGALAILLSHLPGFCECTIFGGWNCCDVLP